MMSSKNSSARKPSGPVMLRNTNSSLCEDVLEEISHDSVSLSWQEEEAGDDGLEEVVVSKDPSTVSCSTWLAESGGSKELAHSIWEFSWDDSSSASESDGGQQKFLGVILGTGGFSGSSWQRISSL